MRLAVLSITSGGKILSEKLAGELGADLIEKKSTGIADTFKDIWERYDGFICVMAAGIVVRSIAKLLQNKKTDPCVIVVDEAGRFVISLLSGHLGGGNRLARKTAEVCGGQEVITTASDSLGLTAIDLWAEFNNLMLAEGSLTKASAKLVNTGSINLFIENFKGQLPNDFKPVSCTDDADLIISNRIIKIKDKNVALLRPKNLVVGVGCNRGTAAELIKESIINACRKNDLSYLSLCRIASIDLKKDEKGLLDAAHELGLEIKFYSAEQLNCVNGISRSNTVFAATGAYAVAEPSAMLAADSDKLLARKQKWKDATTAIAEETMNISASYQ